MNCCDYDCNQGDSCPARVARQEAAEQDDASEREDNFNPLREICIGFIQSLALALVCGVSGFLIGRSVA